MGLRIDDAVRHWWDRSPWEGMSPAEVERAVTARVAELIEAGGRADARRPGRHRPVPEPRHPDGRLLRLLRRGDRGRPRPPRDHGRHVRLALGRVGAAGQAPPGRLPVDGRQAGGRPDRPAWPSRTRSTGPSRPRPPACGWWPCPSRRPWARPAGASATSSSARWRSSTPTPCRSLEGDAPADVRPRPASGPRARAGRRRTDRPDRVVRQELLQSVAKRRSGFGCAPGPADVPITRGTPQGRGEPSDAGPVRWAGRTGRVAAGTSVERQAVDGPAASGPSGLDRPPGGAGSVRPWTADRHVTHAPSPVRIGVLASGSGTILEAILADGLPVRLVAADRPCRALEVAPAARCPDRPGRPGRLRRLRPAGSTGSGTPRALADTLVAAGVDVVVMAGFGTVLEPADPRRLPGPDPEHPPGPAAGVPGVARRPRRPGRRGPRDGHHRPRGAPGDGHRADPGPGHGGRSCPDDTEASLHERIKAVERTLYPATIRTFIDDLAAPGRGWGTDHLTEVTE